MMQFQDRLADLEHAATLSVPAGALPRWYRQVEARLRDLEPIWQQQQSEYAQVFAQILRENRSLRSRIEVLRHRELDLGEHLIALCSYVASLRQGDGSNGHASPRECASQLRERLLRFVLDSRVYHEEIATWQSEAMTRQKAAE